MFTGIIQEVGTVKSMSRVGAGIELMIHAPILSGQIAIGDSVSINGVCLTAIQKDGEQFAVVAVEETLHKTTLGGLAVLSRTNLELALQLGSRIGGHIVLGHVDCVGMVESIENRETSWLFNISITEAFQRYTIPVGSIALDGVSLTIATCKTNLISVSIIPHTMQNTIFSKYERGTSVNLEFDVIGKYIEKLMHSSSPVNKGQSISTDQLQAWGFEP